MKLADKNLSIAELQQLKTFIETTLAHVKRFEYSEKIFLCIAVSKSTQLSEKLKNILRDDIDYQLGNESTFFSLAYAQLIRRYSQSTADRIAKQKGHVLFSTELGNGKRIQVLSRWLSQTTTYLNKRIAKEKANG